MLKEDDGYANPTNDTNPEDPNASHLCFMDCTTTAGECNEVFSELECVSGECSQVCPPEPFIVEEPYGCGTECPADGMGECWEIMSEYDFCDDMGCWQKCPDPNDVPEPEDPNAPHHCFFDLEMNEVFSAEECDDTGNCWQ